VNEVEGFLYAGAYAFSKKQEDPCHFKTYYRRGGYRAARGAYLLALGRSIAHCQHFVGRIFELYTSHLYSFLQAVDKDLLCFI